MGSLLMLVLFAMARVLHKKWPYIIFVPVFFTVTGCILVLWLGHIPFDRYFSENRPITFMLGRAVVALGVLLYKQLPLIKTHFKPLLISIASGSLISLLLVITMAQLLSLPKTLTASLLPLGITTPIAIEVAHSLGGDLSITS